MTATHILLVDDEEAIVYVFRRYLELAGYRVSAVVDPAEALAIGSAGGVDMLVTEGDGITVFMLVTDFRMPGMTGASLVARLRELQPGLPALVVTAYGAEIDAAPAGVRVLSKPLAPQDLVDAVARTLGAADAG